MSFQPNLPATRDWVQNNLNPMTVTQRVTAASIKLGGVKPPQDGLINGYINVLDFSPVTENEIFLTGIVSESFQAGGVIDLAILWTPKDTLAGTVGWEIEYAFTSVGNIFGVGVVVGLHEPTLSNLNLHKSVPVSMTGATRGDSIALRLYRNVEDDSYPNAARLFGVEFEMTTDRLGK